MANILAPFGFRLTAVTGQNSPNNRLTARKISKSNSTAIFHGDPVTSLSTGYIAQSAAGTTQIAGIFVGCKYLSTALGRTIWNNYWPGSDAAQDVEAYIIDDPTAVFMAQVNGGPVALADVGSNINFTLTTAGNTSSGISGAALDGTTVATTSTLPFRIVGYVGDTEFSGVGPGSDPTSANNYVFVTFNNQDFKVLSGI